jgi:hypothetical protein
MTTQPFALVFKYIVYFRQTTSQFLQTNLFNNLESKLAEEPLVLASHVPIEKKLNYRDE